MYLSLNFCNQKKILIVAFLFMHIQTNLLLAKYIKFSVYICIVTQLTDCLPNFKSSVPKTNNLVDWNISAVFRLGMNI